MNRRFLLLIIMIYKIPLLEFTEEYRYSAALSTFLYIFLGGQGRRYQFIAKARAFGMSRSTAERIWDRGAYVNKYIAIAHWDFCSIRTRHSLSIQFAVVTESEFSKVTSLNAFKNFMMWLHAGKVTKTDKEICSEEEYLRHSKSISLNGLAKKTGLSCKQSACRRMKNAIATFWGNKTSRFTQINGKLARLSNVYSNNVQYIFDKYSNLNPESVNAWKGVKSKKVYVSRTQWNKIEIKERLEWLRPEEYEMAYEAMYF